MDNDNRDLANQGFNPPSGEGGIQDSYDPDALYRQGMAYYRGRHWREAKLCFERVRALQPNRRGVDALLRELDIFLQLEAVGSEPPRALGPQEMVPPPDLRGMDDELPVQPTEGPLLTGRGCWLWLVVVALAVLIVGVVLLYLLRLPPFAPKDSAEGLKVRCRSNLVAQNWCTALGACAQLAEVEPQNLDALNGVDKSKSSLYKEALSFIQANDAERALRDLQCIADSDPDYNDVSALIATVGMQQQAGQLYLEARDYVETRAYGDAELKLLQIRELAPEYRPGTIQDDLYEVYMGRGALFLALAADEIDITVEPKSKEPSYLITDAITEKVRLAQRDFAKAMEERSTSRDAQLSEFLAARLQEGLERYAEWSWQESATALREIYDRDPGYLNAKSAAVLCDALYHLAEYNRLNGDYRQALIDYLAMQALSECSTELVAERVAEMEVILTPTATATATPTATSTPTNTLRPTSTRTNTPRATMTPIPTPTTLLPTQVAPTSQPSDKPSKPKPTPKPRRQT